MSNCIRIRNNIVQFNSDEFNIEKFTTDIELHQAHFMSTENLDTEDVFCWFLKDNSVVDQNSVTIYFGDGLSSHTWRDFKYLIQYLNQNYVFKKKKHTFIISDEYDNFTSKSPYCIEFAPLNQDI